MDEAERARLRARLVAVGLARSRARGAARAACNRRLTVILCALQADAAAAGLRRP